MENNLTSTRCKNENSFTKFSCNNFIDNTNLSETNIKYEALSNFFKDNEIINPSVVNILELSFYPEF